jgi:hypothetical protein
MLSFSVACLLAVQQTPSSKTPIVENRGKLGTWYWRSPGSNVPSDDASEEQTPILERKGDDYLPGRPRQITHRPIYSSMLFNGVQVNINAQGQNITGDAANEPSLSVDPNNKNRIVVGWRQFDNVASNFRQAGNGYSLNGGVTWNQRQVFTPGTFRSDPVLVPDALGNFYYNSLQQTFFDDVFASANGGIDYTLRGPATGGDKQWMTCDTTKGPGRGFLYQCWSTAGNNYNGRQFSRSVDGVNWMNPINIPNSPIWGTLDVAKNGDLYICGMTNNTFQVCRSSNAQNSAVTPTFDRVRTVNLGGAIVFGSTINPAGLLGQAWIATDKSNGTHSGNIYMLCSVGINTTNPCEVRFVRSTDGGLTWSAPTTLNTDTPGLGASHWFGSMAVAPSGRIDVCWLDNRANPAVSNSALFFTSSYDGGVTWTPNVQLSDYFNPNVGYPNQNKMGDYMGVVSDTQGGSIAYAATHNGEQDIWFLRVPSDIAMPSRAIAVNPFKSKVVSGGLSDLWNADGSVYNLSAGLFPNQGRIAAADAYFNLPVNDIRAFTVKVKATTTAPTTAVILLWNWKTQNWEKKASVAWPSGIANETTLTINSGFDTTLYWNNNVRCMVQFTSPNSTPFNAQIDLLQLLFG